MPKSDMPLPLTERPAVFSAIAWGRLLRLLGAAGLVVVLAACASGGGQRSSSPSSASSSPRPGPAPAWERDGPGLSPPTDLASIPDAVPVAEPFRSGPMRPYEVLGRSYVPITEDIAHTERGLASWYGRKFHGRRTASGEPYDMYAMTAAHPTLPLPSYVRVRNPANNREVVVRVNDRGPFHPGRIIDLSYTAALKLDLLRGVAPVEIERITGKEIRSGSWRGDQDPGWPQQAVVAAAPPAARELTVQVPQLLPISTAPTELIRSDAAMRPAPAATLPVAAAASITMENLPAASPAAQATPMAGEPTGYWVQLGAFRERDGAESFQRKVVSTLNWIAPVLAVRSDAELHRLQAGPYTDRDQAGAVAERLRESLQLVPVIVEMR